MAKTERQLEDRNRRNMEEFVKRYSKYAVAVAFEFVIFILLSLPQALKTTSLCADNVTCGWLITVVIIVLVPIPILWLFGVLERQVKPYTGRLKKQQDQKRQEVFTLSPSSSSNEETFNLCLLNKSIKPSVEITKIEIGDKDQWISRREFSFQVKYGEQKEIEFIKLSKRFKYFSIADDIKESEFTQFKQGKYKFDIAIVYGNGSIQWFEVTVVYTEPDKIVVEL